MLHFVAAVQGGSIEITRFLQLAAPLLKPTQFIGRTERSLILKAFSGFFWMCIRRGMRSLLALLTGVPQVCTFC
jgi:hypothetical protein